MYNDKATYLLTTLVHSLEFETTCPTAHFQPRHKVHFKYWHDWSTPLSGDTYKKNSS